MLYRLIQLSRNFRAALIYCLLLSSFSLAVPFSSLAQKALKIKGEKVSQKELYFSVEDNKVVFFTKDGGNASAETIDGSQDFSLTHNYVNLFFQWQNPLRFRYSWKDSIYTDEEHAALRDFTKLLLPVFNVALPEDDKAKSTAAFAQANDQKDKPAKGSTAEADTITLTVPSAFKDTDLTFLYIQLITAQETLLKPDEIKQINKLTPLLEDLDGAEEDFQPKVKGHFKSLVGINSTNEISDKNNGVVAKVRSAMKQLGIDLDGTNTKRAEIETLYKNITLSNSLMNSYFRSNIRKYLDRSATLAKTNKELIEKFEPVIGAVENSVPSSKTKIGSFPDYYKVREVKFEDTKAIRSELVVTSYKLNEAKMEMEKDAEPAKATLTFRAYDPIRFTVSTGIFYGSTSVLGYGFRNAANGDMLVTADTISKNSAVTAIFGNFNFGIGSNKFAPLVQLGVDPTKKHPFFLAGGGFSIPAWQIAFSAGGIWTSEPSLKKLKEGDKIASSTDLEKDIKNNFQVDPKGWYIGIQYNF